MQHKNTVADDAREMLRATELIELGARMPVLEKELNLSRSRLVRLYRELTDASPPKGMLPFSADWYFTRLPNIHASLFYNTYLFLLREAHCTRLDALTRAYRLYLEHCDCTESERVLSFTRAWTLLRFFDGGLLTLKRCTVCSGRFVSHAHHTGGTFTCCVCATPAYAAAARAPVAARHGSEDPAVRSAASGANR